MKKFISSLLILSSLPAILASGRTPGPGPGTGKKVNRKSETFWVDSVLKSMSPDRKIAQLMMVRVYSEPDSFQLARISRLVRDKGVGGLVFFQGGPLAQAEMTNYYQRISRVPLWIAMDAEWGLAMRLDSLIPFPKFMELGALRGSALVHQVGLAVGRQCRRIGVQIDFAPVMDINNNPDNPVINDRSFGQNKYKVANDGIQFLRGVQQSGVIAVAKHFPGHGDTNIDSHKDLPEIDKSLIALDTLELYPFRRAIAAGVKGIMVGHLHVPAIDPTPDLPSSLSKKAITGLLRSRLGFRGLVFSDALDMKGVTRYFPGGMACVKALQAGVDVLVLPESIDTAIRKIRMALMHHGLSWATINARVKRVLRAKYEAGLQRPELVDTGNLVKDLNSGTVDLDRRIAAGALTVLNNENFLLPLDTLDQPRIAYVAVGADTSQEGFARELKRYYPVDAYYFPASSPWENISPLARRLKYHYDQVIIGVHGYQRFPENRFGLSEAELLLIRQLQNETPSLTLAFGNPYAIRYFSRANTLIAAYEDDSIMYRTLAGFLFGRIPSAGRLPVSVGNRFPDGTGLDRYRVPDLALPVVRPSQVGLDSNILNGIDDIAREAIDSQATPGCVILAARDGKIFFQKAYGYLDYEKSAHARLSTLYDMASCTKICATTLAAMRLYDQGKLKLDKTLGDYLPWLRGSNKAPLKIRDVMLHEAGLVAFIPFYQRTLYDGVHPDTVLYSRVMDPLHTGRVAENLYMNPAYRDTMFQLIRESKLGPLHRYVYSDNDFILMQKIVESLTGMPLDQYVKKTFYDPLGLKNTMFRPRSFVTLKRIAPTEDEKYFRLQLIRGDVHDPGAAMFGGVSGHAGLFSDVGDLAVLMQMVLNGGSLGGRSYIKASTIRYFSGYRSKVSRRGLGWDKPQRHRAGESDPYPSKGASSLTYGHYGFTGTCIWVDPRYKLIYIFLSNRVNPYGGSNQKINTLDIRSRVMETLYQAMGVD